MGTYLNQLPPAEVARLKAELAETLIANFCYPRFYDYRVNALRMRPVDRAKRQEVWQYLSAVDFNVWGRVDLVSPDFQRQVERLLIHFVQRNRAFFGAQGRKRMFDVRLLITTCAAKVVEGLRGHLMGQQTIPPFGSPRPVSSWSTTNIVGRLESNWEQVATTTMLLQQQMQEVRGEVRGSVPALPSPAEVRVEARPSPTPAPPRRVGRGRVGANGSGTGDLEGETVRSTPDTVGPREVRRTTSPLSGSRTGSPVAPMVNASMAPPSGPLSSRRPEQISTSEGMLMTPPSGPLSSRRPGQTSSSEGMLMTPPSSPPLPASSHSAPVPTGIVTQATSPMASTPAAPLVRPVPPTPRVAPLPQPPAASVPAPEREVTRSVQIPAPPPEPAKEVTVNGTESVSALGGEEDLMIFEQLQNQLMIWLRIEAVRSGINIAELGSFQLLERLSQEDGYDLARLQVVSTLLKLTDQVISTGRASLLDYKQAMMFYLMHNRRSRF